MNEPVENAGFKIAIRTEGQFVNAYLWPTVPGTKPPILMGSIRHSIASPETACIDLFGMRPELTIERGPEGERSGRA